jgi:hypothetical protein
MVHNRVRWGFTGALLATFLTCGCSSQSDPGRFVPPTTAAETALRHALSAWKAGKPAGPVPDVGPPAVQVVDAGRKPGQVLADFRILGETQGPTGRTFVVQLNLKHPDLEERARYIVIGVDPLWVFRQEDYDLLAHWDHHMPETAEKPEPEVP